MIILSKYLTHEKQSLHLFVTYDVGTNTVDEIKSIFLLTYGKSIPVGDLLMKFFEKAINQIIDETDWREIYRQMGEYPGDTLEVMTLKPYLKAQ
jgi:hypothetical protein